MEDNKLRLVLVLGCFRIIWEGFYGASVCEVNLRLLRLEGYARGQFVCEEAYACEDSFGLAP